MAVGGTIGAATGAVGGLTLFLLSFVTYLALKGRLPTYLALATTASQAAAAPSAPSSNVTPQSSAPAGSTITVDPRAGGASQPGATAPTGGSGGYKFDAPKSPGYPFGAPGKAYSP